MYCRSKQFNLTAPLFHRLGFSLQRPSIRQVTLEDIVKADAEAGGPLPSAPCVDSKRVGMDKLLAPMRAAGYTVESLDMLLAPMLVRKPTQIPPLLTVLLLSV